jgi:hypothetical protein
MMITKRSNNNSNGKTAAAAVVTIRINSIQHSPSEANRSKARQEIPQVLCNLKVLYLVYNSPTLVPVLSYINLVHILPSYFFKIHFNTTLPFMPKSPKWYFPLDFPIKTLQAFLFLSYICHTCPTVLILLNLNTLTIHNNECKS